jgi:hypothetical protein
MNISYAITVCNEIDEIKQLVPFLLEHKHQEDQICVLLDKPKAPSELVDLLYRFSSNDWILLKESNFHGHFANWKNELNRMCNGNYIFNIDADEIPSETLIKHLPEILENNPDIKAYAVPRVNTVEGLTQEHIHKWRWNVNEKGWVNYPDYQIRIYKNTSDIFWEGKVHESLNIRNEVVPLPMETEDWVLYHPKTIERQEKQNNYYSTL